MQKSARFAAEMSAQKGRCKKPQLALKHGEHPMIALALLFIVCKSFIFKRFECVEVVRLLHDDMARHGSPAHLCVHHNGAQFVTFAYLEGRLNDAHGLSDALSNRTDFSFPACQVQQDAVIIENRLDENIGQTWLPKVKHRLVVVFG